MNRMLFFDSRPNLGVLAGLCVFVAAASARWWRYPVPGARASLTGPQTLLGLLNLLCSLVCVSCVLLTVTGNWPAVVVGVLWVCCTGGRGETRLALVPKCR